MLTITNVLRKVGVVGKFVEFFGPGVASVPLANRATIGNMSPEYGATCAMFPIDEVTLDYLRFSGRDDHHVDLVEAYAKAQGMFWTADSPEPVYSQVVELDLATVVPSIAGPSRPQDLVALDVAAGSFRTALDRAPRTHTASLDGGGEAEIRRRPRGGGGHHLVHQHLQPPGHGGGRAWWPATPWPGASPPGRGSRPPWPPGRGWSWTTSTGPG